MMEIFCDKNLNEHNWAKITVIFGNLLVYVAMLGFNALATFENPKNTLFQYSVGGISDVYFVEITPAGWVFGLIWTTIFVWNLLWMLYALANIWRRTENGNLVYRRLNFFPSGLFLVFAFNNVVIIAWLFVWAGLNLGWSLFLIILAVISVDICVLIVARKTYYMKDELRRLKHNFDVVALYITLNGLGFFATWLSLATNLNMAQFLTWVCGAEDHIAETIALINILIIALVYSICENFFWHRFLLYMFSPWVVANLALAGSISKNWNTISNRNQILLLVLIIMTALLTIAKIVFVVLYNTVLKHRLHNHKVTPQQQQSVEMKEPKKTDVDI